MSKANKEARKGWAEANKAAKKETLNAKQTLFLTIEAKLKEKLNQLNKEKEAHGKVLLQIETETNEIIAKWVKIPSVEVNSQNDSELNSGDVKIDGQVQTSSKTDHETNKVLFNGDPEENKDNSDEKVSTEQLKEELEDCHVIVCLGKTGLGKSTFLNRFCGDDSVRGNKGHFKTGDEYKSETSEICHLKVINKENGKTYCIVDTPGTLDTYNRDKEHKQNISRYLRGCGGVNAFLVFYNLGENRVDQSYIDLLKYYSSILDNVEWWKHVILIGTHYDVLAYKLQDTIEEMKNDPNNDITIDKFAKDKADAIVKEFVSNKDLNIGEIGANGDKNANTLPLVTIGKKTHKEAIKNVLKLIPSNKFICDNIASSIPDLQIIVSKHEQTIDTLITQYETIKCEKRQLLSQIDHLRGELGMESYDAEFGVYEEDYKHEYSKVTKITNNSDNNTKNINNSGNAAYGNKNKNKKENSQNGQKKNKQNVKQKQKQKAKQKQNRKSQTQRQPQQQQPQRNQNGAKKRKRKGKGKKNKSQSKVNLFSQTSFHY